jgi:isocitrate dehydrogenase kinase/phosphatase
MVTGTSKEEMTMRPINELCNETLIRKCRTLVKDIERCETIADTEEVAEKIFSAKERADKLRDALHEIGEELSSRNVLTYA